MALPDTPPSGAPLTPPTRFLAPITNSKFSAKSSSKGRVAFRVRAEVRTVAARHHVAAS